MSGSSGEARNHTSDPSVRFPEQRLFFLSPRGRSTLLCDQGQTHETFGPRSAASAEGAPRSRRSTSNSINTKSESDNTDNTLPCKSTKTTPLKTSHASTPILPRRAHMSSSTISSAHTSESVLSYSSSSSAGMSLHALHVPSRWSFSTRQRSGRA